MGQFREENVRGLQSAIVVGVLIVVLGCTPPGQTKTGLKPADPSSVTPPATAGSAESLVGTTWQLEGGSTLTFSADGLGTAAAPPRPPMPMGYTLRDNGVITVVVGESSRAGTWDGKQLVLDGVPLKRVG